MGLPKSLVIQGCLRAYSEVYLSKDIGLQSFVKKSLAMGVKFFTASSSEAHLEGFHLKSFS
jgi:hypothetical protein